MQSHMLFPARSVILSAILLSVPCGSRSEVPLIQIAVEIVEVDENTARHVGIQISDHVGVREAIDPMRIAFGALRRKDAAEAELKLLLEKGRAELLANPKLVTKSGGNASFRAGGEIPYIGSGSLGSAKVEFKPYGVGLDVSPRLEQDGRIDLAIKAEVSSPDQSNAASLSGNTVPGLLQRTASTTLSVLPGQTLTIAGLIQNRKERLTSGVPVLSQIPLLGMFFSRTKWSFSKTTVMIFVTPTLVEAQ